jgi:hypothetical protein
MHPQLDLAVDNNKFDFNEEVNLNGIVYAFPGRSVESSLTLMGVSVLLI